MRAWLLRPALGGVDVEGAGAGDGQVDGVARVEVRLETGLVIRANHCGNRSLALGLRGLRLVAEVK